MTLAHTFVDPRTWLTLSPPNLNFAWAIGFTLGFVVFVALGIVSSVFAGKYRRRDAYRAKVLDRLATWFAFWGILGMLWTFCAYETVNLFGAPFWLPLGIVAALAWLATILRFHIAVVPKLHAAEQERAARERYLPQAKKK